MMDSTFTLPLGHGEIFRHDFHYYGWVSRDTLLSSSPPSFPGKGNLLGFNTSGNYFGAIAHTNHSTDWIFWIILAGLILLVLTKIFNEKRIGLLIAAIFSRTSAIQLIRESGFFRLQSVFFLLLIYLISVTLLFYRVFIHFDLDHPGSWRDIIFYLEIAGALIAFFLVKTTLIRLSGILFKNPETASEYIQTMVIFNLSGGIVLLPMLLFVFYWPSNFFLYFTLGLMAILMIIRFIRGFMVGLSDHKFTLFHLFLYLCTLEILPVLVAAKFIGKYFFQ